jgi:uncharacterized membrane protein YoaK (UPF0700 family)
MAEITMITDMSKMTYRKLEKTKEKSLLEGFITSSFVFGALCGVLMATYLGEKFGRQRAIMIGEHIFLKLFQLTLDVLVVHVINL